MENSVENWISQHLEMEEEEEDDVWNQNHMMNSSFDEEEFLREILERPADSSSPEPGEESEQYYSPNNNNSCAATCCPINGSVSYDETSCFEFEEGTLYKSNTSNPIIMSLERSASASPATATYLFSFDNSSSGGVEPIIHDSESSCRSRRPPHTVAGKDADRFEAAAAAAKKVRGSNKKAPNHIMAERKRREQLTRSIIALSATIPGLKKMDKLYVLGEAVNYMKKLQERIKELENQDNDGRVDSTIFIGKSQASSKESTTFSDSGCRSIESLPEVAARVLDKEVLIGIHCEKQKNIVPKIHVLLKKLHLSIATSSVLPFGTSTLIITIIAQMSDKYSMTIDNLVANLREDLLERSNGNDPR